MTVQELDERLAAVAAFVPSGARLADIGADHAHLPLALAAKGQIVHAIAADANEGPFEAARRSVQAAQMTDVIDVRLGDGIAALAKVETLILQPQSDAAELRAWLYDNGWHIAAESLVRAGGRLYAILLAKRGRREKPEPILLEIGPILWQEKPPLLREHIDGMLSRVRRARAGMEQSARAREGAAYRACREKIAALEGRLLWESVRKACR